MYTYAWKNNPVRAAMHGRRCKLLAVGKMSSALVQFDDGKRVIVSIRALRRSDKVKTEHP